ncbi:hypothetical protein CPB83DRAFT_910000 [Crepidotus variabilis]|uniref:Uncharacterized protein n=1 Tax=Crepidotus variabilis TaxID=179855 RepID=A0A9P6E880_9AGAR|nr:hypothetical protein CPB83DRAFT_910000 [Crepidotus variabilis]
MLDTSPGGRAAFPQIQKSLKRSASTISLPTPPRTHRRHARGRSRGSCDSDSDGDKVLLSTDDELGHAGDEEERGGPSKKRRMGESAKATDAADEDAFWLGGSSEAADAAAKSSKADALAKVQAQQQQQAPLLYRKRKETTTTDSVAVAPVSPPPSHRKKVGKTPTSNASPMAIDSPLRAAAKVASPPSTPKTRSVTRREALLRDSPDNPFLVSPVADSDSGSPIASSNPSPRTPSKGSASYDKPFINYVFRGTRRTFQNPYFNHAEDRPMSPPPASKLPIDHPEYSPSLMCPPKVLFPTARGRKGKGKSTESPKAEAATTRSKARRRSLSPANEEDEEEDTLDLKPKKLNFEAAGTSKVKVKTTVTTTVKSRLRKSPGKMSA